METVTIAGATYYVVSGETPEDQERAGRPNYARHMRSCRIARDLYVRRPTGRKVYSTVQFQNGQFGRLTSIPGF